MTIQQTGQSPQGGAWSTSEAARTWHRQAAQRAQFLGAATELMLEAANIGVGSRVLDVAAGTGDQTLLAARWVGPSGFILATDISASMLEITAELARQETLSNVATHIMDAQHNDLEANSFDAVISRDGLVFMPNLHEALGGMYRVLKPGGKVAALVWSAPERNPVFALPMVIVRRSLGLSAPTPGAPGIFALGTPDLFAGALQKVGFRNVTVRPVALRHRFFSAAALMDAYKDAAGGRELFSLLDPLGEAGCAQIVAEIELALHQFDGPDGFEAPAESLLGVGTK